MVNAAPVCISERDIIHFIGQRDVTVCVNIGVLTDHFENYRFEVSEFLIIIIIIVYGTFLVQNSTTPKIICMLHAWTTCICMYHVSIFQWSSEWWTACIFMHLSLIATQLARIFSRFPQYSMKWLIAVADPGGRGKGGANVPLLWAASNTKKYWWLNPPFWL